MKKYIYFLFCFITLSNTAFAQKSPDKNTNSTANKTLISKDLKIRVDKDSGNFIFYAKEKQDSTTENNSKDWVKILSEKTIPSSYFLFLKNGASIGYGSGEKGIHTCQIKWNEIKYAWENAEVRIISSFCFSENRATSSYDGFKIKLNIQNISKNEIELTPIACFDGNNDTLEEHYFTSNQRISNEQELLGSNIKDFLIINTLIKHTSLKLLLPEITFPNKKTTDTVRPKRIFFTNWRRMKNYESGFFPINANRPFNTEPYSDNDSAAFIEFPNTKIQTDSSIEINFNLTLEKSRISVSSQARLDELFQLLKEINQKLNKGEVVEKKYLNDLDDYLNILQ